MAKALSAKHRSYVVKYRANKGTLIGGVTSSVSSPWQAEADAQTYLRGVLELNGSNCVGGIQKSKLVPTVVRHCGLISQAVGAICPNCRREITQDFARRCKPIPANSEGGAK